MIEESDTITVYDAIRQMRKLSSENTPFSFSHATFNSESLESNGMRHVQRAVLRPSASKYEVSEADFKLFYKDLDNNVNRNCWQALLMFFNGKKCILN